MTLLDSQINRVESIVNGLSEKTPEFLSSQGRRGVPRPNGSLARLCESGDGVFGPFQKIVDTSPGGCDSRDFWASLERVSLGIKLVAERWPNGSAP